jgi:phosphoserine phosphatase RsbU/P
MARVLIADDDQFSLKLLEHILGSCGLEIETCRDGEEALASILAENDAPHVAILDWNMPGLDGVEICERLKKHANKPHTFLLMLTGRDDRADIVRALQSGADDYLAKPAHKDELRARVMNAVRMVDLQLTLARRVTELEEAMTNVKLLQGLLPICTYCKNVRNDDNYWQKVDAYFSEHSELRFSHGICPHCYDTIVEPQLQKLEG